MNTQSAKKTGRLNLSDLARALGRSKSYISKLKKQGKIIFDADGLIDFGDAVRQLEQTKDARKDAQRVANARRRSDLPDEVADIYLEDHPEIGDVSAADSRIGIETQRSRLARETYEAKLRQIEYLKQINRLVPVEDIERANSIIASSIRSGLLALPTKLSKRMENKKSNEIRIMLTESINEVLVELFRLGKIEEEK